MTQQNINSSGVSKNINEKIKIKLLSMSNHLDADSGRVSKRYFRA